MAEEAEDRDSRVDAGREAFGGDGSRRDFAGQGVVRRLMAWTFSA